MNPIRVAILVLGVAAAGGAVMLALSPKPQAPDTPAPVVTPAPQPAPADLVLVAARDLPPGHLLTADDVTWRSWPKESLAPFMVHKDDKVVEELAGSIVRTDFFAGEPIRREQLIKGSNSGFLSAVLPSGKRAVAITIDTQGSTSAGNFVLPNDRVDVIRTVKLSASSGGVDSFASETLLENIRVLAIGQNVQDKNGQTVVVGSTATLEVDPKQAETLVLAQRGGQLSLALRSMLDAQATATEGGPDRTRVIRYGVESDVTR
jgi:pilus assembly protein CpaB